MAEKRSVKAGFDHFLYYHKTKVIIFVMAIALFLFYHFCLDTGAGKRTVLYGELLNQTVDSGVLSAFNEEMLTQIGGSLEKEQILLSSGNEIDVEDLEKSAMTGSLEVLTTEIFSHELDFLIGTCEVMEYYAEKKALADLNELSWSMTENAETYFVRIEGGDGEAADYGIDVSGRIPGMKGNGLVLCILKNSERKEKAVRYVEALLSQSSEPIGHAGMSD